MDTECPGCSDRITMRISSFATELLRFYALCPVCSTPIRGSIEGHEYPNTIILENESLPPTSNSPTVTVDALVPIDVTAASLNAVHGGPNITFFRLLKERAIEAMQQADATYEAHQTIPKVRRLVEYYEQNQSARFRDYVARNYDADAAAALESHSETWAIHAILENWLMAYWPGLSVADQVERALDAVAPWVKPAIHNPALAEYMSQEKQLNLLRSTTRGLLASTKALMHSAPAWRAGHVRNAMAESGVANLEALLLTQDEFPRLRDTYQQLFESICDSLWIFVAMRNQLVNGSANDCSGLSYLKDGVVTSVGTMNQFRKLPNAFKLGCFAAFPEIEKALSPLDSLTRNAIGHASAHHNLATGKITSADGTSRDYFDFVAQVYSLTGALGISVVVSGLNWDLIDLHSEGKVPDFHVSTP